MPGSPAARSWATVDDIRAVLGKRWGTGRYLRQHAAGERWEPISVPVHGPRADELLDRLDQATAWLSAFEAACRGRGGRERLRIEYRMVAGRMLGRNQIPARVWVDTADQLYGLLGVTGEVRALERVLDQTKAAEPRLVPWVAVHPQEAIAHASIWPMLLATVAWVVEHEAPQLYLRHVDVEGVDTKFVETYRMILSELLETVLPEDRVDRNYTRGDFAGRFRFRRKPEYARLRFLSPQSMLPAGISEITVRTAELATLDPGMGTVFVVENEISYLAFPEVPDSIVVFGSGFALDSLKALLWLEHKRIIYWGDIDTYGFVILNRLRARSAHVRSMLMDHDTLLAHPRQWVTEPTPTAVALPHLTDAEAELYRDLVEDRFGRHVRLEQERIRFSRVRAALASLAV